MNLRRFGPTFPRLFTAAIILELSFSLLIHVPGYLSELGATEAMIGLLFSMCGLASLLMRPLLGRVLDLRSRRTIILIAAGANIVVLLLLATAQAWSPYLWALIISQRVIQLALFTTILTYAADTIEVSRRTQGLAIYGLTGLIPIAIGGLAGDITINAFGFVGLFVVSALASMVAWYFYYTLPAVPVGGTEKRRNFWSALAQKNLLPLWLATLLFSVGLEVIFIFTRTYVQTRQIGTTGAVFLAYGLSAATLRIIGGRFYDRFPHRYLLVGAIVLYGSGLVVLALAGAVPFVLLGAALAGSAHGIAFPLLSSQVVNRARESERGSAMSVFTSIFDIAILAGAPAAGVLIDRYNYLVGFGATGVVLIVGAMVYALWDRRMMSQSGSPVGEEALQ